MTELGDVNARFKRVPRADTVASGLVMSNTIPSDRTVTPATPNTDLQAVIKEVVGFHVLLTRSLFGAGIPRRFLQRVSLAKPTSALLQY